MLRNRLLAAAGKAKRQQASASDSNSLPRIYAEAAVAKIYEDLPLIHLEGNLIRLLHILPGSKEEPLRCNLTTCTLDEELQFEALSYAWRDSKALVQEPNVPVHVNGSLIYVLPNLGNALKYLRLEDRPRALWVDFLCINQARIPEVDHQVSMMGAIYRTAQQVLAFMGAEPVNFDGAIQLLRDLSSDSHLSEIENVEICLPALAEIVRNDWWRRVWTVQESMLAKKLILQCGSRSISWELMNSAYDCVYRHVWSHRCCYVWLLSHKRIVEDVLLFLSTAGSRGPQNRKEYENSTLVTAALNHLSDETSDARDHVFGLLGLLSSDTRLVEPDYSLTVPELFTKVARATIDKTRSLHYLLYPQNQFRRLDMPSWVADLSQPDERGALRLAYEHRLLFAADGKTNPSFDFVSDKHICCKGWFIDTISNIQLRSTKEPLAFTEYKSAKIFCQHVQSMKQLAFEILAPQLDSDDDSHLRSFLRTATFGVLETATESDRRVTASVRRHEEEDYPRANKMISLLEEYVAGPVETPIEVLLSQFEETKAIQYGTSLFFGVSAGKFFITKENGRSRKMGMGPPAIQTDDRVVIVKGVSMPLIVRKVEATGDDKYELIGAAYLDEAMDGMVDGVSIGEDAPCSDINLV